MGAVLQFDMATGGDEEDLAAFALNLSRSVTDAAAQRLGTVTEVSFAQAVPCPACGEQSEAGALGHEDLIEVLSMDLRSVLTRAVDSGRDQAKHGRSHGFVAMASVLIAGIARIEAAGRRCCEKCQQNAGTEAVVMAATACRTQTE